MTKFRRKGIVNQHHGNYGKMATKKQTAAQKRNFSIFRLRGIEASLSNIACYGYLKGDAASELIHAKKRVQNALRMETGK